MLKDALNRVLNKPRFPYTVVGTLNLSTRNRIDKLITGPKFGISRFISIRILFQISVMFEEIKF